MSVSLSTRGYYGSGSNAAAPTITIVSPTPNTPAGDPGGFSDDPSEAADTFIVLDVDATAGLAYACVVCRYPGSSIERVVYAAGDFRGEFAEHSFSEASPGGGLRLHCKPSGGWPDSGALYDITFDVDAVGGDASAVTTSRSA